MQTLRHLNAADAFAAFPQVRGHILEATVGTGWAILNQGPSAFGVVVEGEYIGCCPTRALAERVIGRAMVQA